MASPYLPHPPAQLPLSGLLRAVPASRRPHDDAHGGAREHTRAPEPPGGEFAGQLPGDPCPDRLASGDHPSPASHPAGETAARLSDAFTLPAVPASVGAARRRVRAQLDAWHIADEIQDDAIVVTSELVTNAVTHSASEYVVYRLRRTATTLRIEVEDQNRCAALPTPRCSAPDDQSGRGLLLVAAVSAEWGIGTTADGGGLIVWAELATGVGVVRATPESPVQVVRTTPERPASPVPAVPVPAMPVPVVPDSAAPAIPAPAAPAAPVPVHAAPVTPVHAAPAIPIPAGPAIPSGPAAPTTPVPAAPAAAPERIRGTAPASTTAPATMTTPASTALPHDRAPAGNPRDTVRPTPAGVPARSAPHSAVPDHLETATGPSPTRPKDEHHAPTPGH
ncbi:ATP-binding protein [Streptomyces sp. NPDC004610]|uniref:ATP-binding protein n=1 Tax=unclassified Streptomyces TaxID=2593676 RepID=UPI00339E4CB3